jgi:hypothetical protein
MGIKEGVADVEVKTIDIKAGAVTTEKIASSAILLSKLNKEVGVWTGVHVDCTLLSSAKTTAHRTILSSAVTVLAATLNVTTDDGVDATIDIEDSSGNSMVQFPSPSAAITHSSTNMTALGTFLARKITAGGTVCIVTSTKQNAMIGDLYLLTITTPT